MLKIKSVWLVLVGLFVFSALAWAAPPQDYKLGYIFKNPDGSAFRIIRYYLRDGNKFRAEYITLVQLQINNTESNVEALPTDTEPQTVEILRKDKGLVWTLDPSFKVYFQGPLRKDAWDRLLGQIFIPDLQMFKKAGETQLLNYPCDIYQTAEWEGWSHIITVARGFNVVLKDELLQNGKLAQTTEPLEFRMEKPAPGLFEIPQGYKKN